MTAPVLEKSESAIEPREERLQAAYAANADLLLGYLRRFIRNHPESAEDLLQETMLRAWRHVDQMPSTEEAARRWLLTVARHLAIDAFRVRLTRPVEIGQDDIARFPVVDDALERVLTRQVVDDALRGLDPGHRAVLVHLYYGDAPVNEVAAGLGLPSGTIRSRSFYALRTVRKLLERDDRDS
jgi:RNA polymerase sigma-70 factor (ECF subfamily)